ncbi:uncharacterized protein KY384_007386 [Bacidia gigantensis]|uniref:uncharacterized protein n=1 Tax=Bacidia gigantensis TaxID=2732470 RepID=UPI001D042249|nr:uncharacterized protein KY384_007386 [Bacidia gigantensis]KAG8528468.1 hypothetical protein KY384_007386 [Bacidia gigantensis]
MINQDGLQWDEGTFSLEPKWTRDPSVTDIKTVLQPILQPHDDFDITFVAQGAFNKLYKISCDGHLFAMRISLPVDPFNKTNSEVATLQYVREGGSLPVPKVCSHNSSAANPIGFEWILMEYMPGRPLREIWKHITWDAKEALIQRLAKHCAAMYENQFDQIGNHHLLEEGQKSLQPLKLGQLVSIPFLYGDHPVLPIPRGPFRTSREWLEARLLFKEADATKALAKSEDDDEREEAETILSNIRRLHRHIDEFFPSDLIEKTMLVHPDLSQSNVLLDANGELTAVVDWECVSTVPLWQACNYPRLIEGSERYQKPDENTYAHEENGEINEIYWYHLEDYQKTQLREFFLEQMSKLEPGWIQVYQSSQRLRDFDMAVENCDGPFSLEVVSLWLDLIEDGEKPYKSLERRLRGYTDEP